MEKIKIFHDEAHEVREEVLDLTRGLAAAFGGTTNKTERERESPGIKGLSRSRSVLFVVRPA